MDSLNHVLAFLLALSFLVNLFQGVLNQRRKVALLDAKIQYLFEKTGVSYEPIPVLTPAIRKAVAVGKKIEAIKLYRDATGSSLKQAKDEIEKIMS
jgi:ribosomal protein L7/L12